MHQYVLFFSSLHVIWSPVTEIPSSVALHSLHLHRIRNHDLYEMAERCFKAGIGPTFDLSFKNLCHISLHDESVSKLFEYLFSVDLCPALISVNIKLSGMRNRFLFPARQSSRIRFLSTGHVLGLRPRIIEDETMSMRQIGEFMNFLKSLATLQHFAYCGFMESDSILNVIPSNLQTLVTTLYELENLQDMSGNLIPSSILSARILSPLARSNVATCNTLLQATTTWTEKHNLHLEVMPLEWTDNCAELTAETIMKADISPAKHLYGPSGLRVDGRSLKEKVEADAVAAGAAEDWYECWEQFRTRTMSVKVDK